MGTPPAKRRDLLRSLAMLPIGALAIGPRAAGAQPGRARDAIEKGNRRLLDALARGDAAGCAAIYAESAKVLAPGAPMHRGRKAILAFWQGAIDSGVKAATLAILDLEDLGRTAIEVGAYTLDIRPQGKPPRADEGKYVTVWKRQRDGAWKLTVDIFNSNQLPA